MGSIHPPKRRDYGKHTRIDPDQSYQVAYWKQRFGISEEKLIEAVRATGGLAGTCGSVSEAETYRRLNARMHIL
jgi:hypothetical protein